MTTNVFKPVGVGKQSTCDPEALLQVCSSRVLPLQSGVEWTAGRAAFDDGKVNTVDLIAALEV
jgi:hypothetical protein